MNIKVIAACLACTALSLSACSSSVNCSECGKALDVSADTYVMQSGSPFCGDCAARDEIAAGVGEDLCFCWNSEETIPKSTAIDMGAFSNNVECFLCGPCYKQHLQENGEDYDTGFKDGKSIFVKTMSYCRTPSTNCVPLAERMPLMHYGKFILKMP